MKFNFLAGILVVGLVLSVALVINKKEFVTHKKIKSSLVKFDVKDFPEHGISLIAPSDPSLADMEVKLTKPKFTSIANSYSAFLKNTGSRAVVGYRIKWECVDSRGEVSERDVSNIVSWIFLYGKESDRRMALNKSMEIIKPDSIWLISLDSPAQPLESDGNEVAFDTEVAETIEGCASVTIIADGIFFDDGTFIGPDTTSFFTEVKSQMDARYEILRGVQDDLKAGKEPGEIFRGLEKIRDDESVQLGEQPTSDEFRIYFRNLFARDVLGKKELWGGDKAIKEAQVLLSKPWVNLRKL